ILLYVEIFTYKVVHAQNDDVVIAEFTLHPLCIELQIELVSAAGVEAVIPPRRCVQDDLLVRRQTERLLYIVRGFGITAREYKLIARIAGLEHISAKAECATYAIH